MTFDKKKLRHIQFACPINKMKTYILILLTFLAAQFHVHAELRIIGVKVTRAPNSEIRVSIASDEAKEKMEGITVKEASKILSDAKGWGSSVIVGVEAHGVRLQDYLPLLKAISENDWLDLSFVEGLKPDFINNNIKKSIEQVGADQPATRSESKSEGGDKPQPESEGRSR